MAEQANVGLICALAFTVTSVPIHNEQVPEFLPEDDDIITGVYYLMWLSASLAYIVATFLSVLNIVTTATLGGDEEIVAFFKSLGLLAHVPMMLLMLGGILVIFAVIFNMYFATSLWTFIVITASLGVTVILMGLFGARLVQAEWDAKTTMAKEHAGQAAATRNDRSETAGTDVAS